MNYTDSLSQSWETMFGASPPVAHLLRESHPDRWVRFHSLPESKRYPENEEEMVELLARHNAVLGYLAKPNSHVTLLSAGYSDSLSPVASNLIERSPIADTKPWRSVAMHEVSDDWSDPTYWHIFATVVPWAPQVFDSVFQLVAQGRISNVMVLSEQSHWLYHPYDGGSDAILATQSERDRLKHEFSQWLSSHPLGL